MKIRSVPIFSAIFSNFLKLALALSFGWGIFVPSAFAGISTFTATNGFWNTAGNWDPVGVPGNGTFVVIKGSVTLDVITGTLTGIYVMSGATITTKDAFNFIEISSNPAGLPAGQDVIQIDGVVEGGDVSNKPAVRIQVGDTSGIIITRNIFGSFPLPASGNDAPDINIQSLATLVVKSEIRVNTMDFKNVLDSSSQTIRVRGNWVQNGGGSHVSAGSDVRFEKVGSQIIGGSATPASFSTITINGGTAGNVTSTAPLSVGTFVMASGSFTAGNFEHTVSGDLKPAFAGGSRGIEAQGSTITFNGSSAQNVSFGFGSQPGAVGNINFNGIKVTNSSPGGVTFSTAITANFFTDTTGNSKLFFNSGSTYTFTNLNLNGNGAGTRIQLRGTSAFPQYFFNITQASVSFVDVSSCAATGVTIAAGAGSLDSGNNLNWTFGGGGGGGNTPLNPTFSNVTNNSLQVSWLNTPTANYNTVLSTAFDFSVLTSSFLWTTNTTTYVNLSTMTFYYFKVKISTEGDSAYTSPAISTQTLASAPQPPPTHDNIVNAKNINLSTVAFSGGFNYTDSTGTGGATTEIGEPAPTCLTGFSHTVWYRYLATTAVQMTADTFGSNYNTTLQLRKTLDGSTNFAQLTAETCNDDFAGPPAVSQSQISSFNLAKGSTYFFQIAAFGAGGLAGNLVFSATMTPVSADEILPTVFIQQPAEGAFPSLASLNTISGTSSDNAAVSEVQIRISSSCFAPGCLGAGSRDWDGAAWSAAVPIWLGAPNTILGTPNSSSSTWNRGALPPFVNGNIYFIRARAKDSSNNFSAISLSSFTSTTPAPAFNDDLATAGKLFTVGPFVPFALDITSSVNNTQAIYANQASPAACPTGNRDVWWRYSSTITAAVEANTFGSDFDTVLAVWDSTAGAVAVPNTLIGCNDDAAGVGGLQSKVAFQLQAGATYLFQIYQFGSGTGGNVTFHINRTAPDTIFPSSITTLTALPDVTAGSVKLQWTAVGDDGTIGTAFDYVIKYTTFGDISSGASFDSSNNKLITDPPVNAINPSPALSGTVQSIILNSLPQGVTVWFGIQVRDKVFNRSISNSPFIVLKSTTAPTATNTSAAAATVIGAIPFSDNLKDPGSPFLIAGGTFPLCRNVPPSTSVALWYKYVSTASGVNLTANTFNSIPDTVLQLWRDAPNNVSEACNDDAPGFGLQSKVNFITSAGTTYFFELVDLNPGGNPTLNFQLSQQDSASPGNITSLSAQTGVNNGEVNLSWREPAANGYDPASGNVASYQIRYSSLGAINSANWSSPFSSTGTVLDIQVFPINQIPPTPISVGNLLTYTIRNLNAGTTYWFSVRAQDNAGNLSNPSNSPFVPAKAPVTAAGDGGGSVQLRDVSGNSILTSVPVSSQVTINIRFTVGSSSITGGGKISVQVPGFWGQWSNDPNYLTAVSTFNTTSAANSDFSISIDPQNPQILVATLGSAARLNVGDIINIRYRGLTPFNKQNGVQITVKSQGSSSGILLPIASQPSLNIVAGAPAQIGFTDWNFITLGSGQESSALFLEPKDNSWQSTTADKDLKLRLFTLYWDTTTFTYRTDLNAQVSKLTPFSAVTAVGISTTPPSTFNGSGAMGTTFYYPVTIPNGASNQPIYYKTSTLGDTILWIEYNNDFDAGFSTFTTQRWFRIRGSAAAFNNLSVTPNSISPDGDTINDFAAISFNPSVSDSQWRVRIGTDPVFSNLSSIQNFNIGTGGFGFTSGAAAPGVSVATITAYLDWFGFGQPQGVTWYGNDFQGGVAPNGTYIVRVEDIGGSPVSTTTLVVSSSFLDVRVTRGGNPVSGAFVSANGQSGSTGGFVFRSRQTGADGRTRIWGLKAGITYNLNANFFDAATGRSFNQTVTGAAGGAEVLIDFSEPAQIRIHANIPQEASQIWDQWGFVNVTNASNGFPVGFGSLRFSGGSLESDSGWSPTGFPSTWTVVGVPAGGNYRIHAEVFGFSPVEITTNNVPLQPAQDFNLSFVRRPRVYGSVFLPAVQPFGTWVSIEGTKVGDRFPTIWSGAWIPGANDFGRSKTTGTFVMDVDTATYLIRARTQGLGSVSTGPITITSAGIGTLQSGNVWDGSAQISNGLNLTFGSVAPGVTGYITVTGDTSQLPEFLKTVDKSSFTIFINANSQANNSFNSTQVQLPIKAGANAVSSATYRIAGLDDGTYDLFTWLEGFQVDPPGPQRVTVTNGSANFNLNLKQFGGKLTTIFDISPAVDFSSISLSVSGPISFSTPALSANDFTAAGSTATYIVPKKLGTGFYTVNAFYNTNGQSKSVQVNVVNGQVSTVTFSLNAQVFSVTGTVKVQAFTFGQTAANSSGTRINSISDLTSKLGNEFAAAIGTGIFVPIARIEAFPRNSDNFESTIGNFVNVIGGGNVGGFGAGKQDLGFGGVRFSSITEQGNWRIDKLPPGVYILRHPMNLDPNANNYSSAQSNFESNTADVRNESKTILIKQDGTVQVIDPPGGNLEFTYQSGSDVSGQVQLPSDIPSDTRFLTILCQNSKKEIVSWQSVFLNNSNSANYKLPNLAPGDYSILVQDERRGSQTNPDQFQFGPNLQKYVAKPKKITVTGGSLTNQNISLLRTGYMEGKLAIIRISSDGTKSTELITTNNLNLLPSNFNINPNAPSLGGFQAGETRQACNNPGAPCSLDIDSTKGTFLISSLYPDTEYLVRFKQDEFGANTLGQGKLNLVPAEKNGLSVGAGQTLDLGTVELNLGATIRGAVVGPKSATDSTLVPIPNLRIRAAPGGNTAFDFKVNTFTDEKGSFTITGLNPDFRFYNIIFAARNMGDESIVFSGVENRYAQKTKRNVDLKLSSVPVDAQLDLGLGEINGQVTTSDGGTLRNPFEDGFPGADIILNKQGDVPVDNPLGDIEVHTDITGKFKIDRLAPGTYDLYPISLGYGVSKIAVTVPAGAVTQNIPLTPGLSISGNIAKTDGSKPRGGDGGEIDVLAAANADFSKFVIAGLKKDAQTQTVEEYTLAGLQSGTTYFLLFFNEAGDTINPPERFPTGGDGVAITTNVTNFNLTFAKSKPDVFMKVKKTKNKKKGDANDEFRFEFNLTQGLRNKSLDEKSDNYWQQVVTLQFSTNGVLKADPSDSNPISPDRKQVAVLYTPAANTDKVTLKFKSFTSELKPGSSDFFQTDVSFDYFTGLEGQKIAKISAAKGGNVAIEGDNSQCVVPAGTFYRAGCNPCTDADLLSVSSSVSMGLQKVVDDVQAATSASTARGAPALNQQSSNQQSEEDLPANMPPVLARAIQAMHGIKQPAISNQQSATSVKGAPSAAPALEASQVAQNVLGAFYDFFLPAGVNRQLKKNAKVTLSFSTATANANDMNIYFYNDQQTTMTTTGGKSVPPGAYGLEDSLKVVDSTNNTITVETNHFTVFVVVNATSPVLGAGTVITPQGGGTTATFNNTQVNILTLVTGTTMTVTGIKVSGEAIEDHKFTLISTGANNAGIIMNVQSHLQTFNLALNQEQLVDLNDDGKKDISLIVTGFTGNGAQIKLAGLFGLSLPDTIAFTGTEIEAFNFPNPFNATARGFLFTGTKTSSQQTLRAEGSTVIRYALPANLGAGPVRVTLQIYDVAGELVRRLDFGSQTTGFYHYGDWDGKNEDGETVASGVYLGRLTIEGSSRSKIFKMAVIK